MRIRVFLSVAVMLLANVCFAGSPTTFAPLESWKAAVVRSDVATLRSLYSNEPAAQVSVSTQQLRADADVNFWAGLKAKRVVLKIAQSDSPQPGVQQIVFQAEIRPAAPARTLYVSVGQIWQQQGTVWRLVSVKRTDAAKLEQPLSVDAKIYPTDDARGEIRQALGRAAKVRKRVLVVFGADWCYDCHVLDKAFQREDIAAVLRPSFEVVHVDVGEGNKNQDLMNEYDVPMKRGIPAIAVLDSNGKLLYSQKNGEFERARALGPEDLLEFLKKWKPQAR
jgi:thioredoxin 1